MSIDLTAQRTDEAEVAPPSDAGEHARALLVGKTGRAGNSRKLYVAWAEQAPILFVLVLTSPAELDFWESMARLVERQRQRFAQRAVGGSRA